MRVALEHAAIHESAGVAFIAVADDILDPLRGRFRYRAPLQSCRITRAAPPAQPALDDFVNDLRRRHLRKRVHHRTVALGGYVVFDPIGIDDPSVFPHDSRLALEE